MRSASSLFRLVNFAHFLDHYLLLVLPTAAMAMPVHFGGSFAERLGLGIGMTLAFGFGHLPWGWLADRMPRIYLLRLFLFASGAASLLVATVKTPWQFTAAATLLGRALAIYHTIGTPLVTAAMGRTGRVFGVNGMFGNAGVATAILGTAGLLALGGWRLSFAIPGLMAIGLGVQSLFVAEPAPTHLEDLRPSVDQAAVTPGSRVAFVVLGLSSLAGGLLFQAISFALPKLLADLIGAVPGNLIGVGALVAAVTIVGALAQFSIGRLAEVFPSGRLFQALTLAMVVGIGMVASGRVLAVPAGLALTMMALFGLFTVEDAMLMTVVPTAWRSRAMAFVCLASFCTASAALPLVAWSRARSGDFSLLALVLLGAAALVCLFGLFLPRRLTGPSGILSTPVRPDKAVV